jgi:hypothetical protein
MVVIAESLVWPASASAQEPSPAPGVRLGALPTVFVRDVAGTETQGKLLRLDDDVIVVLVDGQRRQFELSGVASVQKRGDSVRNGAIVGAAIGFGLGFLTSDLADCQTPEGYGQCHTGARVAFTAMSTAIYGLLGAGIDALVPGRTTLYQRPVGAGSAPAGRSIAMTWALRW